jgi:hypothetical protein
MLRIVDIRCERIQEAREHTFASSVVNQRITTLVVAQGTVDAIRALIEYKDFIGSRICELESTRQAELEGHIEARRCADTTQIVNRNRTRPHKIVNSRKTAISPLAHLKNAVWLLTEKDKSPDKRYKQSFVRVIEWRVDEDGSAGRRGHQAHVADRERDETRLIRSADSTAALARRASTRLTLRADRISEALALLSDTFACRFADVFAVTRRMLPRRAPSNDHSEKEAFVPWR